MLRISPRYLDSLIPNKLLGEKDDLFKIRFYILMMVIGFVITFITFFLNYSGLIYVHDYLGIEFTYIVIPFIILWLTKKFHFTVHIQMLLASSSLTLILLQTGGIASHIATWLFILPILVLFFIGFRAAIYWNIFLFFNFVFIYVLSLNPNSSYITFPEVHQNDFFYNNVTFLFFIGISIYLFWSGQHRLFLRLKDKQEDLKNKNEQLESKTEELRFAKEALINSNQSLDRYARAISHDLKEPLRSITGFTSLLYRHYDQQDLIDDRSQEFFDFVLEGGKNMDAMIKEMLLLSKLPKHGANNLKLVNLNEVVQISLQNLDVQIKETKVEISTEHLPFINGLHGPIVQLFQNIISNAIKFRRPNITPRISIQAKENELSWTILISDNGIGIQKEDCNSIFNEFGKIHKKEEYQGHGIGLATCHKIIQQHDGEIGVQSTYGKGSIFYFTLPKAILKEEKILKEYQLRTQKQAV